MCAASATSSTTSRAPRSGSSFPWSKGLKVEEIHGLLRRDRLPRLDPQGHRRAGAQGAAPRVRDVEPGHPRARRRRPAPTATCRRSATRGRRSATTGCAARCSTSRPPARLPQTWPRPEELKDRVEQIQDRHLKLRKHAMDALVGLIADLKAAKAAGRSDADSRPRAICSAARSSTSTSSRRRTRPASTRRRRRRASSASRSTTRARASSRCATRVQADRAIVDIPPPQPGPEPGHRGTPRRLRRRPRRSRRAPRGSPAPERATSRGRPAAPQLRSRLQSRPGGG